MAKKTNTRSKLQRIGSFQRNGTEMSEQIGKVLVEKYGDTEGFKEQFGNFKEDNTMSNSSSLYTTVLSNFIYSAEYTKFNQYFSNIINLTPQDLGMPQGAGAYQIPKMNGAKATKLAPGEKVEYVNDNKSHFILETETYGIGTSISRRLIKRGAAGMISRFMQNASNAVLREVASELANGMVVAADSNNTVSGGITIDKIADAKYYIESASNPNTGAPFGFTMTTVGLTAQGKRVLTKSADYKTLFSYGQNNVPGDSVQTQYMQYDGADIVEMNLISVQKGGSNVHAICYDKNYFMTYLQETDMEVFDGRIQGTAGDDEIIHALDAGFAVANAEAGSVITE